MRLFTKWLFLVLAFIFFSVGTGRSQQNSVFFNSSFPSVQEIRKLKISELKKIISNSNSILMKQYLLNAASSKDFSPVFQPQEIGAEFYSRLDRSGQLGLPIFVRSNAGGCSILDEVLMLKLLPSDKSIIEVRTKLGKSGVEKLKLSNAPSTPLEMYYDRMASWGKLIRSGIAFTIPETRLFLKDGFAVYFVPENLHNPINEKNVLYGYISEVNASNIAQKITNFLKALNDLGLEIKLENVIFKDLFLNETGFPQKYVNDAYFYGEALDKGLYASTYIMPRKTGFDFNIDSQVDLVRRVLGQKFISSSRERMYSYSGSEIKKWHLQVGNEDKVFLSYGSGITYADPNSFMLLLSPRIMFLERVELLDRDSFYFKPRLYNRDPLSESWFSSYEESPIEINALIRTQINRYIFNNDLNSFNGRAYYMRSLESFLIREGLATGKKLSCSLYEEFNNEVRVSDAVFIDDFGECLIVPSDEIRNKVIKESKAEMNNNFVAGIPLEDFIVTSHNMHMFLPDGTDTDYNLKSTYIEYLLRESRSPAYLALGMARRQNDTYSVLRIIRDFCAEEKMETFLNCPELSKSRKLRQKLRSMKNVRKNWKYSDLYKEYKWWLNPGILVSSQALTLGPLSDSDLETIRGEIVEVVRKHLNILIPVEKIVFYRREWKEDVKYISRKGDSILVNFPFLSMIRYRCGIDGVYHLFAQEMLSGSADNGRLYANTSEILKLLGKKPCFIELAQAMELSNSRIEKIRNLLPE